ncbi:MAG: four helix bundle protein [Chloroflexota bacterium]|nr:four helix bundle protein [Chloroflexota bacterium]
MAFRFEGLEIWHLARGYATHIYAITARFPKHERFWPADQMNRAANSVVLNIAEGSGQDTFAQFNRYLGIATGSVCKVVSGIFLALDRGYIDEGDRLIRKITNFCKTCDKR